MATEADRAFWRGRSVLVTGHTGFIGSWLTLALLHLGARVTGYSDKIPTSPSLYGLMELSRRVADHRGEISDAARVREVFEEARPSVVFHLAAQPIVRRAYREPFETYRANLLGTLSVLEALRAGSSVAAAIMMTTDKVYRNNQWVWPYRETDPLGGHEPYSLSKAMADMAIEQYRTGYFGGRTDAPHLVAVRAGNVIGGGDWSEDRLVPDAARAWSKNDTLFIRSPGASRPWQHVLDVVDALLFLGCRSTGATAPAHGAYNIGPEAQDAVTVRVLVEALVQQWGAGAAVSFANDLTAAAQGVRESVALRIDTSRFRSEFGVRAELPLVDSVGWTVEWYKAHAVGATAARHATDAHVERYFS